MTSFQFVLPILSGYHFGRSICFYLVRPFFWVHLVIPFPLPGTELQVPGSVGQQIEHLLLLNQEEGLRLNCFSPILTSLLTLRILR